MAFLTRSSNFPTVSYQSPCDSDGPRFTAYALLHLSTMVAVVRRSKDLAKSPAILPQ
jgi:hypothetical protein